MAARVKFGIQTPLDGIEWGQLLDFWRLLDRETSFHSLWTFDHFVPPMPGRGNDGPCFEGWTALAAAAQATERLRLGCLVTGVTYRHPSVLAKMAATVDHISNGRLEFGIGAAWHEPEHRVYGIPFPPVRERQDRLEEAVQLIRLLFSAEGPVTFEGKYYELREAPFSPPCVQKPHPPILVGGGGEKRTLRTAARYADIINVQGPLSVVKRKIEVLERHCADVGRHPSEITKSIFSPVFATERQDLADRVRRTVAMGFGLSEDVARNELPIGEPAHVRDVIEEYAALGVSYVIMISQGPYNFDVYRRLSKEIVEPFL